MKKTASKTKREIPSAAAAAAAAAAEYSPLKKKEAGPLTGTPKKDSGRDDGKRALSAKVDAKQSSKVATIVKRPARYAKPRFYIDREVRIAVDNGELKIEDLIKACVLFDNVEVQPAVASMARPHDEYLNARNRIYQILGWEVDEKDVPQPLEPENDGAFLPPLPLPQPVTFDSEKLLEQYQKDRDVNEGTLLERNIKACAQACTIAVRVNQTQKEKDAYDEDAVFKIPSQNKRILPDGADISEKLEHYVTDQFVLACLRDALGGLRRAWTPAQLFGAGGAEELLHTDFRTLVELVGRFKLLSMTAKGTALKLLEAAALAKNAAMQKFLKGCRGRGANCARTGQSRAPLIATQSATL